MRIFLFVTTVVIMLIVNQFTFAQSVIHLKNENIKVEDSVFVTKNIAEKYYNFFANSNLFKWKEDLNNNCEDRSNAISILLDKWGIPNYKIWIFSSNFLNKGKSKLCGNCPNSICWNFHVATIIPYKEENTIKFTVIDPSTLDTPNDIIFWTQNITCDGTNYYLITKGDKYIYSKKGKGFSNETFWERNDENFKWTMQGLSGINGKSALGKVKLLFRHKKVKETREIFNELMKNNPIK